MVELTKGQMEDLSIVLSMAYTRIYGKKVKVTVKEQINREGLSEVNRNESA